MPYSKSLGLIFVAIPKTGTTSLTHLLSNLHRSGGKGLELVKDPVTPDFRKRYRFDIIGDKKPGHAKHLSAIQLKFVLGEEEFNRCASFSVVRNPWARMVSRYFFTHVNYEPSPSEKLRRGTSRNFHNMEFESWLKKAWKRHKRGKRLNSQLRKLVDMDGEILVDHVGRLENIELTLDWISNKLGVTGLQMPHINGTRRGHYAQYYNRTTREMVEDMCRQDIEYFNYQFEG